MSDDAYDGKDWRVAAGTEVPPTTIAILREIERKFYLERARLNACAAEHDQKGEALELLHDEHAWMKEEIRKLRDVMADALRLLLECRDDLPIERGHKRMDIVIEKMRLLTSET